jgi:hypothetical protein
MNKRRVVRSLSHGVIFRPLGSLVWRLVARASLEIPAEARSRVRYLARSWASSALSYQTISLLAEAWLASDYSSFSSYDLYSGLRLDSSSFDSTIGSKDYKGKSLRRRVLPGLKTFMPGPRSRSSYWSISLTPCPAGVWLTIINYNSVGSVG